MSGGLGLCAVRFKFELIWRERGPLPNMRDGALYGMGKEPVQLVARLGPLYRDLPVNRRTRMKHYLPATSLEGSTETRYKYKMQCNPKN